jgi:hypothetical protein
VIAVGYQSESLVEYVRAAHPDRAVTFVPVDNLDGPGSGPGYSLACCREHLQRPFFFSTADCLLDGKATDLSANWIGVSGEAGCVGYPQQYSTVRVSESGWLEGFRNKCDHGYSHVYVGVCGVRDHEQFWRCYDELPADGDQHVGIFQHLGMVWRCDEHQFFDTGSAAGYEEADLVFRDEEGGADYELKKVSREITYRLPGRLVKLGDPDSIEAKIARAGLLAPHTPPLTFRGKHLYAYEWVDGDILYALDDHELNWRFVKWCEEQFWSKPVRAIGLETANRRMYLDKTVERLARFVKDSPGSESDVEVSFLNTPYHTNCPNLWDQMAAIDWDWLCRHERAINFHGDLNFGNVVYGKDGQFHLIDWRDTYGGLLVGDVYYDLGKLMAGLLLNWRLFGKDRFSFHDDGHGGVTLWHEPSHEQGKTLVWYGLWLRENGYDTKKVYTVAALVCLSMCPLHPGPMGEFLFYYGRHLLETV